MAGCNQAGGAEPQSPGDDSEPSTVTSIEQVSHVCLQCCLIDDMRAPIVVGNYYENS